MSGQPGLAAVIGQLVDEVCREPMRPVERGAAAVERPVERILRHGNLTAGRWVECVGRVVDEGAPGVVRSAADAVGKAAIGADLHRVIDRRRGVGTQPDHTPGGVNTGAVRRSAASRARITIQRLEEPGPLGADVADAENRIARHLSLDFKTELLRDRRAEVFLNDGSREPVERRRVTKISPERRQNRKCVRQVRAVDGGQERE